MVKLIERFSCTKDDALVTTQETITLLSMDDIFLPLERFWKNWCDARLGQYSPNLSQLLEQSEWIKRHVSADYHKKLKKLLKGQYSLRELSVVMHQDLTQLSRSLIGYEQQGWIKEYRNLDAEQLV